MKTPIIIAGHRSSDVARRLRMALEAALAIKDAEALDRCLRWADGFRCLNHGVINQRLSSLSDRAANMLRKIRRRTMPAVDLTEYWKAVGQGGMPWAR